MKKALFIFCTLSLFLPASCGQKDLRFGEIARAITSSSENHNFDKAEVLLIVPRAGCDGCITNSERFIMDNLMQFSRLHVVFTATDSQKALRLKMGGSIYNHRQVFVDRSNLFFSPALMSVYPMVVYLEDGKAATIDYVSPDSPETLASLLYYLKDNN